MPIFPRVYAFRHGESEFEVHFETESSIASFPAHVQCQNYEKLLVENVHIQISQIKCIQIGYSVRTRQRSENLSFP